MPITDPCPSPCSTPILHMHWDGDFVDATGNTSFTVQSTEGVGHDFVPSDSPAFDQSVVGISNGRAFGSSSVDMAIGLQPYCFRARVKFAPGEIGGYLFGKNYHPTQPAVGIFKNDYAFYITPGSFGIQWTGQTDEIGTSFAPIYDEEFEVEIADDGTVARLYLNGLLVESNIAAALDPVPPPITPSSAVSVLNMLQGFSGSDPNWSSNFFRGTLDEMLLFIGDPVHIGSSYEVLTEPFVGGSNCQPAFMERMPQTYSVELFESTVARQDRPGYPQKRRSFSRGAKVSLTYLLKRCEYRHWLDYYRDALSNGKAWFRLTLPSSLGPTSVWVRCIEFQGQPIGGEGWNLSLRLEILGRAIEAVSPPVLASTPWDSGVIWDDTTYWS